DVQRPDDTVRGPARRNDGRRSAACKAVGGLRLRDQRERSVGDAELHQGSPVRRNVHVPIPERGLAEDSAANLRGVRRYHRHLLESLIAAQVKLTEIAAIEQVERPGLAGRQGELRM